VNTRVSEETCFDGLLARVVDGMERATVERTPEVMRELAGHVVELRSRFVWQDLPDWGGRSMGYRTAVYRAYRAAGVPSDSVAGLQANLRYHVGNVVREIAPAEELEAIGLDPDGPPARAVRARAAGDRRRKPAHVPTRPPAHEVPLAVMRDPLALASFAIDAVRAIRELRPRGEMAEALAPLLKQLGEQTLGAAADTVSWGR
jgi:hypothetical protein